MTIDDVLGVVREMLLKGGPEARGKLADMYEDRDDAETVFLLREGHEIAACKYERNSVFALASMSTFETENEFVGRYMIFDRVFCAEAEHVFFRAATRKELDTAFGTKADIEGWLRAVYDDVTKPRPAPGTNQEEDNG